MTTNHFVPYFIKINSNNFTLNHKCRSQNICCIAFFFYSKYPILNFSAFFRQSQSRVATDQIWDTEQFTGIELQKKIQNIPPTYRTIYRTNMEIYRKNTEFPNDLQNRLQYKQIWGFKDKIQT